MSVTLQFFYILHLCAMRWRIQLSYLGTSYCGWQRQPSDPSVQQTLEEVFSMVLRQPVEITGCGRTDAGVHARKYIAHTDFNHDAPEDRLVYQLNAVLPADIALQHIDLVHPEFHARYDAVERLYRYYIHFRKNPFLEGRSFYFHQPTNLDRQIMEETSSILMQFEHFRPFCKTGTDVDHFRCQLSTSQWHWEEDFAIYTIRANRFLRGMVRLVVGACLNVGLGKVSLEDIKTSMVLQQPIPFAWSVPAEGLYLEDVVYGGR